MLVSSAVYCEFKPQSGQTKDYIIGVGCFSTKHTALKSKSKDWLSLNEDDVYEWSDVSIRRPWFQ
jgi:hypothetical protein